MFNMSSIVLVLKTLFPFVNAVVDESLRVCSTLSTERVAAGRLFQISFHIFQGKVATF